MFLLLLKIVYNNLWYFHVLQEVVVNFKPMNESLVVDLQNQSY